jgi:hypothetical protein
MIEVIHELRTLKKPESPERRDFHRAICLVRVSPSTDASTDKVLLPKDTTVGPY